MPAIAHIVARSVPQHLIGYDNKLLWRLKTDMGFFKRVTTDHVIIMGRKTYDSIGRPLPNRVNIVISRSKRNNENNLFWTSSREEAMFVADVHSILKDKTQIFVIGGEGIYNLFRDIVTKVYLTEVFSEFKNGDSFFNQEFDRRQWKIIDEQDYVASDEDEYPFRITVLERKRAYVRHRDLSEFLTADVLRDDWIRSQVVTKAKKFDRLPTEQIELPIEKSGC